MDQPVEDEGTSGLAFLSLDSGRFEGLSCLSQLLILRENLRTYEVDNDLDADTVKAYQVFDLIVGTGSGGLVACLVGPLRMSVSEAIEAYLAIHKAVFPVNDEKCSVEERTHRLRDALSLVIEDRLSSAEQTSRFSELSKCIPGCMVVITALSKANVKYPLPFRSFRGRRGSPPPSTILETTLATLAYGRLFSEVTLNEGSIIHRFIAADLGHSNPLESLISEVQTQFKSQSIALILSIGTGRPAHVGLEHADDFARAASELATSCHDASERFERMLPGRPSIYVRLDADGFDISTPLLPDAVIAHSEAYMRRADVEEILDLVSKRLNERKGRFKVVDLSFPKPDRAESPHVEHPNPTNGTNNSVWNEAIVRSFALVGLADLTRPWVALP
ncbi:hypothetical protein DL96DRAFT_1650666 [Flagelloscypha sp. PMI_526]|nr:hypothetical protein DL96DRAFT_1650666 [Flagelloscypha sp. PMI_526]